MALALDQMAQRYGKRPSEFLGVNDPYLALDFDLAVAVRGSREEQKQSRSRERTEGAGSDPGKFWSTVNRVRGMKGLPPVKGAKWPSR